LLDEMEIHIVPRLLGGGTRLFDNLNGSRVRIEPIHTIDGPEVAHLQYRVVTPAAS